MAADTATLSEAISAVALAGLLAAPLLSIVRAIEYRHGYVVAREKINHVLALPAGRTSAEIQSRGNHDDEGE